MRFKVGDIAILAVSITYPELQGQEVTILLVGPFYKGQIVFIGDTKVTCNVDADYLTDLKHDGSRRLGPKDWQLRKIDPPSEPKSLTRSEELEHV